MTQQSLTFRREEIFTPTRRMRSHLPKKRPAIVRFILWALVVDVILVAALFAKLFYFSQSFSDVQGTAGSSSVFSSPRFPSALAYDTVPGSATERFVGQLKDHGLTAVMIGKITRRPYFTVEGNTVALNGDSIQVFEYPDHQSAVNDGSTLANRYSASSRSDAWKRDIHLYVDGTLVIFYMGSQNSIVSVLDAYAGVSLTQALQYSLYLTNFGS